MVGHYSMYSAGLVAMTKVAFRYFKRCPWKAQLIGFMLATNWRYKALQSEIYNDTILEFYLCWAIYFLVTNKPVLGSLFLALSLSIKSGALLAVPAFLGIIHLHNGPVKLIVSIVIVVGIQVLVAAPFVSDRAAKALGFIEARTPVNEYVSRFFGQRQGSEGTELGAVWDMSIFWRFLGEDFYHSPYFPILTKGGQLAVNVYYFFIRRNSLPQCLYNLVSGFTGGQIQVN